MLVLNYVKPRQLRSGSKRHEENYLRRSIWRVSDCGGIRIVDEAPQLLHFGPGLVQSGCHFL